MGRLALVHKRWFAETSVTDRWRLLFESIAEECGFELAFTENARSVPVDTEMILFAGPAKVFNEPGLRRIFAKFGGKRIVYLGDYQPKHHEAATRAMLKADVILAPELATYRRNLPGKRIEFFPYFFAPHERYADLPWNNSPKMKCVISGPLTGNYRLRMAAATSPHAYVIKHTGSHGALEKGAVVRDDYARTLNEHFCAVSGPLRGGITTKTFEIMAAGALLISEPIADMDDAGLVADKHYVAAHPSSVVEKIAAIMAAPGDYERTRMAGREFALDHHGIRNRVAQFESIVESL